METFLQATVGGLTSGCLYALVALGLTLTFGIGRVTNFAHGEVMIVGGLVAVWVIGQTPLTPLRFAAGVLGGMLACAVLGAILERFLFRNTTPLSGLVLSIGLILVLQEGMAEVSGLAPRGANTLDSVTWRLGHVSIPRSSIVIVAVTFCVVLLCFLLLERSRIGLLWRAMSQDRSAAMLLGVATARYRLMTFVLGAMLAGLAGGLLLLTSSVTPTTGQAFIAPAFAAVIVGGIGDLRGALVGGLLVGLGESYTGVYLDPTYIQVFGMLLLVLVLLVRPLGIWGEAHDL